MSGYKSPVTSATTWSLAALCRQSIGPLAQDTLCEAAGQLGRLQRCRALLGLQLKHLETSPAVAALSLAEYGDAAAIPFLRRALQNACERPSRHVATAVAALSEALRMLGACPSAVPALADLLAGQHGQATQLRRLAALSEQLPRS